MMRAVAQGGLTFSGKPWIHERRTAPADLAFIAPPCECLRGRACRHGRRRWGRRKPIPILSDWCRSRLHHEASRPLVKTSDQQLSQARGQRDDPL